MSGLGDLRDPALLEDPYPTYRRLLAEGPTLWDETHQMWVVSGHAEVLEALRRPETSVATAGARIGAALGAEAARFARLITAISRFLTRVDPPDHARLRALVQKAFTAQVVERMEPVIQGLVDRFLAPLAGAGAFDVMAALAVPLPVTVIGRLLGIPPADEMRFKGWSDDLASVADNDPRIDVLERAQQSMDAMRAFVLDLAAARRQQPGEDLLSGLVHAEEDGHRLTPDELVGIVQVLMIAGQETTTHLIGNGLHALLDHPDQLARLRAEPALMGGAVEECLRFDSPVQARTRVATQAMELGGQRIRAGQTLFLLLGSANRDPRAFPEPDRFDIGRENNHHLAFGHGIHYCLGHALARLEAKLALGALLARRPRLALDAEDRPRRVANFSVRGFLSLPVRDGGMP
jgi:cytochrome P450